MKASSAKGKVHSNQLRHRILHLFFSKKRNLHLHSDKPGWTVPKHTPVKGLEITPVQKLSISRSST